MEIVRPEFGEYLAQIRRTLTRIRAGLQSGQLQDEVDCIDRIVGMMAAERQFLAEQPDRILDEVTATIADLEPLLGDPALHGLAAKIESWRQIPLHHRDVVLDGAHLLFQEHAAALSELAMAGNGTAQKAVATLLANEARLFADVRACIPAVPVLHEGEVVSHNVTPLEPECLGMYLRAVFPAEAALNVTGIQSLPGGRSKETVMIDLAGNGALPDRIVMRRDIEGGLFPFKTTDEYRVLQVVARHPGIPIPQLLHVEADPGRLGGTFMLCSALPGRNEGEYFPELNDRVGDRDAIGRELAGILAAMHRIPASEFSGTHLDFSIDLIDYVEKYIDESYAQASASPRPSRIHIDVAYAWLKRNLKLAADSDIRIVHGDVGLHNMLIDNGHITGLLDWELAEAGSPAREIGRMVHIIDHLMPRADFIRAYLDAGGSTSVTDPARMRFYEILGYLRPFQGTRYANHLQMSGKLSSIVMASMGYDFHSRCVGLMAHVVNPAFIPGDPA